MVITLKLEYVQPITLIGLSCDWHAFLSSSAELSEG